jgi:1,2-diacylglycerol-3-alpha-glucose alpha-1,2-glucosyltransferase
MKVLLYEQNANTMKKSGIGRALRHQKKALELNGIESTFDINDNYDIVHFNSIFPKSYRFMKRLMKKGVPLVVHGHSTYEDFRESFRCWKLIEPIFDSWITKMYGHAPLIVTPTPYSKGLIENYKCTKCEVVAISNGIDLDEYAPNEKYVKAYQDFFNIKEGQRVIIGVGLPFKRKGLYDFIDIARKMPEVTFIWFGHLQKILTQPGILKAMKKAPKNVIFPGYIDGAVIKGAMQKADLMLFPSYEETEGIVALESLASRTPLLVRDTGVYEGWLVDNKNCFKAKTNDEFIEKINYIFTHDTSKIVEEGYKVAEQRSLDKIGKQLVELYQKAMEIAKK